MERNLDGAAGSVVFYLTDRDIAAHTAAGMTVAPKSYKP
jgi:hypothetical protein